MGYYLHISAFSLTLLVLYSTLVQITKMYILAMKRKYNMRYNNGSSMKTLSWGSTSTRCFGGQTYYIWHVDVLVIPGHDQNSSIVSRVLSGWGSHSHNSIDVCIRVSI